MENNHKHSDDNLEQICTVKDIVNKGSRRVLLLEPKKVQCKTCDGKCARMLKPVELIEFDCDDMTINIEDVVRLYLSHRYLLKMIGLVFGIPLFVLMFILTILNIFKQPEYVQILGAIATLCITIYIQIKYIKFNRKLIISKI